MKWKDVPTRSVDIGGAPVAYRELGPDTDVPVVVLHQSGTPVLDDLDPRVIDGIAVHPRVITFDNRWIVTSSGVVPDDLA